MALEQQTEMTREEVDALLGRHETGVLALAREDEPYAIPISYGYDSGEGRFYLRLVSTPASEKRAFLSTSPPVRLVVYEERDPEYCSVVVSGTLQEVSSDELTVEHVEQYGEAKRPLFEIWGEARSDLNISLYELLPETVSGRHIEVEADADT